MTRDLDVILYGAYGCVGHLSAQHLAQQPGLRWAIAGRNATRLHALAATLSGPSAQPEVIVASLDAGNLSSWVSRARAVATAAGPFSVHSGEMLVEACAATGTAYADTSDEFYWQRRMIERHGEAAKRSGARIALASGFCAVAAELGAAVALERHRDRDRDRDRRHRLEGRGAGGKKRRSSPSSSDDQLAAIRLPQLSAWLERYSGGLSRGVIHTTHVNASYPKAWGVDPYVLAPGAPASLRLDTLVDGMRYPGFARGEGVVVPNLFGDYDARFLRATLVARQERLRLRVGSPTGQYAAWVEFLLAHRSSWGSLTSCPDAALLADGSWRYRFAVKAVAAADGGEDGGAGVVEEGGGEIGGSMGVEDEGEEETSVTLSGRGDPGYHFTSVALAEVALCLARGEGCAGSGPAGVLTPGLAVNTSALRARLEAIGLLKVSTTEVVAGDADGGTATSPGDGMGSAAAPVSMPTRAAVVAEWVDRAHGSAPRASEHGGEA